MHPDLRHNYVSCHRRQPLFTTCDPACEPCRHGSIGSGRGKLVEGNEKKERIGEEKESLEGSEDRREGAQSG